MKIHNDIQQGTPEWLQLRLGKFTASDAQAIATNGKGLETLVYEKVAETLTQKMKESYTNSDIERGQEFESIARNTYTIEKGQSVVEVAFVEMDEHSGCSPDGLVGEDGLVEFKCKNDVNFVKYLLDKKIDAAHEWQMQMQMLVTDRKWCDYVVFNQNFPNPIVIARVNRDETMIAKIRAGLAQGVATLQATVEKLRAS